MSKENVFEIPEYSGAGVYAIVNITDFKVYVGQSRNIKKRATGHAMQISAGNHTNKNLQADAGKQLDFLIVHKIDSDAEDWTLRLLELMYMYQFKDKGFALYNSNPKYQEYKDFWQHITYILINAAKTEDHLENAVVEKYGTKSGYIKNRKPENRRHAS